VLAKTPWSPVKPARTVRRLKKEKRSALVDKLAAILRWREPTAFAGEGPCRHGVRASLCLQGWPWPAADMVAGDVVTVALNRVGATRPTWQQGQPEYTQDGALPIERERCIRCRKPLPEGHYKFCSKICSDGYYADRSNAQASAERLAARLALQAAASRR
jgi:hypothetical protein